MHLAPLEEHFGTTVPDELATLYGILADGGSELSTNEIAELLPPEAAIAETKKHAAIFNLHGAGLFWRLGNGVTGYVHLHGPLRGRVYLRDYDGRAKSISYRSARSFAETMAAATSTGANEDEDFEPGDWYTSRTDYFVNTSHFYHGSGVLLPAPPEDVARDLHDRDALQQEWQSAPSHGEENQQHYAFSYMALTPPDRTADIIPFTESPDMWIQARACEILGHRRAEWAIPQLLRVIESGGHNGIGAAIAALGRIGTSSGRDALVALKRQAKQGYGGAIDRALAQR
jgi:hypothetical protein